MQVKINGVSCLVEHSARGYVTVRQRGMDPVILDLTDAQKSSYRNDPQKWNEAMIELEKEAIKTARRRWK